MKNRWTTCTCGHIAQAHNILKPGIEYEKAKPEDWGCDDCFTQRPASEQCKGYQGHEPCGGTR